MEEEDEDFERITPNPSSKTLLNIALAGIVAYILVKIIRNIIDKQKEPPSTSNPPDQSPDPINKPPNSNEYDGRFYVACKEGYTFVRGRCQANCDGNKDPESTVCSVEEKRKVLTGANYVLAPHDQNVSVDCPESSHWEPDIGQCMKNGYYWDTSTGKVWIIDKYTKGSDRYKTITPEIISRLKSPIKCPQGSTLKPSSDTFGLSACVDDTTGTLSTNFSHIQCGTTISDKPINQHNVPYRFDPKLGLCIPPGIYHTVSTEPYEVYKSQVDRLNIPSNRKGVAYFEPIVPLETEIVHKNESGEYSVEGQSIVPPNCSDAFHGTGYKSESPEHDVYGYRCLTCPSGFSRQILPVSDADYFSSTKFAYKTCDYCRKSCPKNTTLVYNREDDEMVCLKDSYVPELIKK